MKENFANDLTVVSQFSEELSSQQCVLLALARPTKGGGVHGIPTHADDEALTLQVKRFRPAGGICPTFHSGGVVGETVSVPAKWNREKVSDQLADSLFPLPAIGAEVKRFPSYCKHIIYI